LKFLVKLHFRRLVWVLATGFFLIPGLWIFFCTVLDFYFAINNEELEQAITRFIDYYNQKRMKKKLNWMSPIAYRKAYQKKA
ncbi:IS3 family transposase, partial [Marinilactibacillus psychrotolerans]|uniref:IS3 family transposase n=1 Tax=Marinilactibacillus psychrotolerans TaxID=191770 RepID=UPI0037F74661